MVFAEMTVLLLRQGGLMQQESISPVWLTKREKNISLDSEMFF